MNPDIEWSSVYTRPRPFDPYIIPLSVRMGRAEKGSVTPPAVGNLELIKVCNSSSNYVNYYVVESCELSMCLHIDS